jgi:hypothetical protein
MMNGMAAKSRIIGSVALLLLMAGCAAAPPRSAGGAALRGITGEWPVRYVTDLEAMRQMIVNNHPGAGLEGSELLALMDEAYREARAFAPQVQSEWTYQLGLSRFASSFGDANVGVRLQRPLEVVASAGIEAAFRRGELIIGRIDHRYGDQAERFRGGRIVSCDGIPAMQLALDRIFSWRGRPAIEGDWIRLAPLLLYEMAPPAEPLPASCIIALEEGEEELALYRTQPTEEEVRRMRWERPGAEEAFAGVERDLGRRLSWLNVPDFGENPATTAMLAQAGRDLADGRWRLLVVDLRGNRGGSAAQASALAALLFGQEWQRAASDFVNDGVWREWRVSEENLVSIGELRSTREMPPLETSPQQLAEAVSNALQRGDRRVGTPGQRSGLVAPPPGERTTDPVVVIVDGGCVGACLDFLDLIRLRPEVTVIGQNTDADSFFLERVYRTLPSGLAEAFFPISIVHNRRRGSNEIHRPDRGWFGDITDTATLRRWIVERIVPE